MATSAMEQTREPVKPAALGTRDAARYIGMSERWLELSDMPRVRLGRRVVYLVADLDAYLRQRRI